MRVDSDCGRGQEGLRGVAKGGRDGLVGLTSNEASRSLTISGDRNHRRIANVGFRR